MSLYDENDIVEIKNHENRKKKLTRFLIFVIIAGIISGLYFTRDMWYDKIRGIGRQYNTIINSGTLAEGNFPIEINGEYNYQLRQTQNNFIILSDIHIFFYNTDGTLIRKRQHTYTNAVLQAENGKALIYENGGDEFCIEDTEGIIYKNTFSNNIMFARISHEGYTAVVTKSENYDCEIIVFDNKGNVIYERKCMEHVSDISFINQSGGCVVSYLMAENGSLTTAVQQIDFSESLENWTSPGLDTAGLDVYGYNDGAFVLGIDACGYINENGQISSYYRYDGELKGGASVNGLSAVIINNDDRRKYIMVLFSGNSSEPLIIDLGQEAVDVTVYDNLAYVMCKEEIRAYDFNGEIRSKAVISDSYSGFARSKDYIFLKGYNKIDRIDYES
ncbi:MAG: DUF5711 family protein [Prevotella sp.]|nr:DUF5711 family protein [Alistipes senegalensis]MCM1357170.1 DUF5711 family protein [Prevotella sp.]MCM1472542.1 DUF5711 family protein [Muribaculaceae bacterium]